MEIGAHVGPDPAFGSAGRIRARSLLRVLSVAPLACTMGAALAASPERTGPPLTGADFEAYPAPDVHRCRP